MAVQAIERGMGAVVIDPKGDGAMRAAVDRAARLAGKAFVEWTPEGPCVYNPFARGGDTEIADKALAGERFTEPHYLRQAQRFLGHVVRALHGAGIEASLHAIAHHLEPARLEMLARSLDEEQAQATHAYLDSLTPRQRTDLAGVRDRLAILAESDVGRWLDPGCEAAKRFDLLDAVRARAVVYFKLDADSRPLLTQMLGAAIVQDLQTTVASLQGSPIPTAVVIDEFASLAAEHVVRLFGRARSAGVSLVLSTQELADLRLPGREALLEQVMGNLTVLIAHRQVVPASAELIAGLAGTKGVWRTSRHGDGRTTRTRAREGALGAQEITGLAPGWAATFVLSEGGRAQVARIFSAGR
jgi:conjugal transfer pilus assembly protein TraD